MAEVVRGEALLHNDIRSDDVLLTPDGGVVVVDWGLPCQGAVRRRLPFGGLLAGASARQRVSLRAHASGIADELMRWRPIRERPTNIPEVERYPSCQDCRLRGQ